MHERHARRLRTTWRSSGGCWDYVVEIGWAIIPHHSELVLSGRASSGSPIIKAVLVALYFMHLKFERKTMGILFASTLILGAILVSVGIGEQVLPRP